MTHKPCTTCKWCKMPEVGNISHGECTIIRDPVTGTPYPPGMARGDSITRNGTTYALPCGFEGKLWEAKG